MTIQSHVLDVEFLYTILDVGQLRCLFLLEGSEGLSTG